MLRNYRIAPLACALLASALINVASPAYAQHADKNPTDDDNPTHAYPEECQSTSKTLPAWIPREKVQKGEIAITSYTNEPWYQAWERTTLSRCTDLTSAKIYVGQDASKHDIYLPVKTVYWRSDRQPLFRGGAGRLPKDIFKTGFFPWKYNGTLDMPSGAQNHASALINTGYWPDYVFSLEYGLRLGNQGYLIDAPGGIMQDQVMDSTNVYLLHGSKETFPKNVLLGDNVMFRNVVVFPGGIRPEFIKGAFWVAQGTHRLQYAPNPNFAYPQAKPDEFDLVVVSRHDPANKVTVTPSPQGQLVGGITHRYKKGTMVTLNATNGDATSCWHVNMDTRGKATTSPLILNTNTEALPVAVVFRGSCVDLAPSASVSAASQAAGVGDY